MNIGGRGYLSSTQHGTQLLIGCKDGTLVEMNIRKLKLEREMAGDLPIVSITVLDDDQLLLAHEIHSGYLDERAVL